MVEKVLEEGARAAEDAAERFDGMEVLDFVGRGSSLASAAEGALLAREAVRLPAACLDTLQYLHGPLEVAEPGRGCVLFGSGREVQLAADLASYGASVLLITRASMPSTRNLRVFRIPEVPDAITPILEMLAVQLLTHRMAGARGLAADGFRHEQEDTKLEVR